MSVRVPVLVQVRVPVPAKQCLLIHQQQQLTLQHNQPY
jgi:hypothetical protein